MPKKMNYELLLIESCLGDFTKQQKLIRGFKGSKFLTETGITLFDVVKRANENYEALDLENYMNYATTMSSNYKDNEKYIEALGSLGLNIIGAEDFDKYLDIVKKVYFD